jgi:hypothetical protein
MEYSEAGRPVAAVHNISGNERSLKGFRRTDRLNFIKREIQMKS